MIKTLGFDRSYRVEAEGFSRGIWILWREVMNISIIFNDTQFIHMEVFVPKCNIFLFTAVYGSPNFKGRQILWSKLRDLDVDITVPWIVARNFNAFLTRNEKKGGSNRRFAPCRKFGEWLRKCALFDLGFYVPKFT